MNTATCQPHIQASRHDGTFSGVFLPVEMCHPEDCTDRQNIALFCDLQLSPGRADINFNEADDTAMMTVWKGSSY